MSTTTVHAEVREGPARRPERVLLATDGGLAGVAAIRWLAERGHDRALEVDVVEVVDADPADVTGRSAARRADATRATEQAKVLLMHLAPRVAAQAEVLLGDPIPTLRRRAGGADIVVVGTNRAARGTPHLTASFATRLASGCSCPVVVVPRGWETSAGPVVVGAEGDGSDAAALDFAAAEAEALHRHLVLVHAWRLAAIAASESVTDVDTKAVEQAASARLSDVAEDVRRAHPGVQVAPVLGHDEPVHALVRAERGAAMVVVGTHGLTAVDRLLLKSVSREVMERPTCPIVVVPPVEPARA
jgi:nucleotide-binding universal stress UspA family protein